MSLKIVYNYCFSVKELLFFWLNIIVIWYYLIFDRNNYDQPNGIMGAHHARVPHKLHNDLTEASHNAHKGFAEALQKLHIMPTKASQELCRSFTKCSRGSQKLYRSLAECSQKLHGHQRNCKL